MVENINNKSRNYFITSSKSAGNYGFPFSNKTNLLSTKSTTNPNTDESKV